MEIVLTNHAKERLKQRNGLNKKSMQRIAERAFNDGLDRKQTSGNLRKFLEPFYTYEENIFPVIKIYGDKVFIFKEDDNFYFDDYGKKITRKVIKLITVLQIPAEIMKLKMKK